MKQEDILKEVLNDQELTKVLGITAADIASAKIDENSSDSTIEVIKAIIKGGRNNTSPQQIFNEIKRLKEI